MFDKGLSSAVRCWSRAGELQQLTRANDYSASVRDYYDRMTEYNLINTAVWLYAIDSYSEYWVHPA